MTTLLYNFRPRLLTAALCASMLVLISCQSKLKVKTVSGKKSPEPAESQAPVEKPGTSRAVREISYSGLDMVVQTRSVYRLKISTDMANGANEFLLSHDDDERQLSLDLAGLKQCDSDNCYPLPSRATLPESPGELFLTYGLNNLKLIGVTATEDLTSKLRIQMRDFQVFGLVLFRAISQTTGQPRPATAGAGTLQSISLLTVPVSIQSGEPSPDPLAPVMISNWQESVERP